MKEFRVAKCLENGKIGEYAIFADGSTKRRIQSDETYGKYFTVPNELNVNETSILKHSFSGRIKDAVDTIRSGNGDCINVSNLFGKHESVFYFLDRKVGEELRAKSLEGWKDTKFAWALKAGYKTSFGGYSLLNEKDELITMFDENRIPAYFDNESDARNHMHHLIEEAWKHAKQLTEAIEKEEDKEKKEQVFTDMLNAILEKYPKFTLMEDLICDMLNNDLTLKFEEPMLEQIGWKVVQQIDMR